MTIFDLGFLIVVLWALILKKLFDIESAIIDLCNNLKK